jgi:hypothetical protein
MWGSREREQGHPAARFRQLLGACAAAGDVRFNRLLFFALQHA